MAEHAMIVFHASRAKWASRCSTRLASAWPTSALTHRNHLCGSSQMWRKCALQWCGGCGGHVAQDGGAAWSVHKRLCAHGHPVCLDISDVQYNQIFPPICLCDQTKPVYGMLATTGEHCLGAAFVRPESGPLVLESTPKASESKPHCSTAWGVAFVLSRLRVLSLLSSSLDFYRSTLWSPVSAMSVDRDRDDWIKQHCNNICVGGRFSCKTGITVGSDGPGDTTSRAACSCFREPRAPARSVHLCHRSIHRDEKMAPQDEQQRRGSGEHPNSPRGHTGCHERVVYRARSGAREKAEGRVCHTCNTDYRASG